MLGYNNYAQGFENHISTLCADSMGGRMPGTLGEKKALSYIQSQVSDTYRTTYQSFKFRDLNEKNCHALNLICEDTSKIDSDSIILFIAHYDHLGNGAYKTLEIIESKRMKMHPGADDNASGVAMVIELGNWYLNSSEAKYKSLLLFTSAHEVGLFGSENFVKSINLESMNIKAVFNFDMVGRLDVASKALIISDNKLEMNIYETIPSNLHFVKGDNLFNSDLRHFMNFPFHLINVTTGIHNDYHRISDTPEKINYQGMNEIFEYVKKIILNLQ
jgi:Zn-dependent M28 family amino/carboxypeptidase